MLFERLLVYHDRAAAGAALNMAIDEALLEQASQPTLRFYGWERPSLSFGYFGKIAELAPVSEGRDVVRRWTGGGIVPHGEDLTYSLITPASDPAARQDPMAIYRVLHQAIGQALAAEGREALLAEQAAPKVSEACFANPVRHDLLSEGRKIAGAAQRRTRRGFLHQGSIQLSGLSPQFRDRFSAALAATLQVDDLSMSVRERAKVLAAEKYGTEAWLRRW